MARVNGVSIAKAQASVEADTDLQFDQASQISTAAGSLFLMPSTGRVGVGTTAPAVALDVIGTASFAGAEASLSQGNVRVGVDSGGDPGGELMYHTDDYVGLRCAGSGALSLAVKPDGKVGIGTTSPAQVLDVIGVASFALAESSLSQGVIQVGVDSGGDPGGELMFHTDDYVGIRCANSGTLPLIVKPSGNVGIGTETPDCALHVSGAFAAAGPSETFQTFANGDTTPSVANGNLFKTYAGTGGATMLDDGVAGQVVTILSTAAFTYDVTGTNLKGGSADLATAAGDVTTWVFDGTNWHLLSFMDISEDQAGGSTEIGHHGYTDKVSFGPHDFRADDEGGSAWITIHDTNSIFAAESATTNAELFVFLTVPSGYTATSITVFYTDDSDSYFKAWLFDTTTLPPTATLIGGAESRITAAQSTFGDDYKSGGASTTNTGDKTMTIKDWNGAGAAGPYNLNMTAGSATDGSGAAITGHAQKYVVLECEHKSVDDRYYGGYMSITKT